jgi:hypothetical protein
MRVLRFSGAAAVCSLLVAAVVGGTWFALAFAARDVRTPAVPTDAAVSLPPPATVAPMASPTRNPAPTTTATGSVSSSRSRSASVAPSTGSSPGPSNRSMFQSAYGDAVVRCEGTTLVYFSVRPESGWFGATTQRSASVLEIRFTKPGEVLAVQATCRSSGPYFVPPGASATPSPSA